MGRVEAMKKITDEEIKLKTMAISSADIRIVLLGISD